MVPSRQASDNSQSVQYQTSVQSIGSCGVCHKSSRGEGHTGVSGNVARWPHAYQWRSR